MKLYFILFLTFFITVNAQRSPLENWTTSLLKKFEEIHDGINSNPKRETGLIEREDDIRPTAGSETSDVNVNVRPEFDPSVVTVEKGEDKPTFIKPNWSFSNPTSWLWGSLGISKPWWKGPNVCVERNLIIDGQKDETNQAQNDSISPFNLHLQSTQCSETETSFECFTKITSMVENKTSTIKYQCCHGFQRPNLRSFCTQIDLKSVGETLLDIGSKKMKEMLEQSSYRSIINSKNITIFSPSDQTLLEIEEDANKDKNEVSAFESLDSTGSDISEILPRSIVNNIYRTGDLKNDMILNTIDNKSTIRINVYGYSQPIVTANCAQMVKPNIYAMNAVIHMVDRAMPVVKSTIYDVVLSDPKYSILAKLLSKSEIKTKLQDMKNGYTLIAPTDEAFRKLEPSLLEKLISGQGCFEKILQSFIIPEVICKVAISELLFARTLARTRSMFVRGPEGKIKIEGANALDPEFLTSNGLIYQVSKVPIPDIAKPISQSFKHEATSNFFKMANESGLLSKWDDMNNVTFFVPINSAIKALGEKKLADYNMESFFGNHIARPETKSGDFLNNMMLNTVNDNHLRISLVQDIPGIVSRALVQCNQVLMYNSEVCGAIIHVVDEVLVSSKPNVMETINSLKEMETFKSLLAKSSFEKTLREEDGPFTILAPSDEAFKSYFTENDLNELNQNETKLESFLKAHILPEAICCSSISRTLFIFNFQEFRNIAGASLSAHRDGFGRVKFSNPSRKQETIVYMCDNMAENGIVHVVNRPFGEVHSKRNEFYKPLLYLHQLFPGK